MYVLNVISMNCSWYVSDESNHLCYRVFVNGITHTFTDKDDAIDFAKHVNANVFQVTDTLIHRAVENPTRVCSMIGRTVKYSPRYYSSGTLEEIIKNIVDAYNDENVRQITIHFSPHSRG